jgi:hypothetical protein
LLPAPPGGGGGGGGGEIRRPRQIVVRPSLWGGGSQVRSCLLILLELRDIVEWVSSSSFHALIFRDLCNNRDGEAGKYEK